MLVLGLQELDPVIRRCISILFFLGFFFSPIFSLRAFSTLPCYSVGFGFFFNLSDNK